MESAGGGESGGCVMGTWLLLARGGSGCAWQVAPTSSNEATEEEERPKDQAEKKARRKEAAEKEVAERKSKKR